MKKLLGMLGALALMSAPVQAQNVTDNVVRIGVLTDLSGVYSEIAGPGSVFAAQMAVRDFSRDQQVLGRPIEIVSADHQNRADISSNKAREWFDRGGVDAIVDLVNSAPALAAMEVAEQRQRITLVSGAAGLPITNEKCHAFNVHWAYDLFPIVNSLPTAMTKTGKKTWFFVTVDNAAGQFVERASTESVKAAGGTVVGSVRHPFGTTTDFSSFLLRAQASRADVIAFANTGQDTVNAIRQAKEFGIGGNQTLVPLLMFANDIHTLGLEITQGMNLVEAFYWDRDQRTREFSRRYFAERRHMPNMIHVGVYSSVLNYLRAVEKAGTDDSTAVMTQLKSMQIDDGLFKGTIRVDGRFMHDMLVVEVKKPSESREPWDLYHIREVIDAEAAAQPLLQSRCKLVTR
jgi:branched-chain amino acid transport system substrate-binding protein